MQLLKKEKLGAFQQNVEKDKGENFMNIVVKAKRIISCKTPEVYGKLKNRKHGQCGWGRMRGVMGNGFEQILILRLLFIQKDQKLR